MEPESQPHKIPAWFSKLLSWMARAAHGVTVFLGKQSIIFLLIAGSIVAFLIAKRFQAFWSVAGNHVLQVSKWLLVLASAVAAYIFYHLQRKSPAQPVPKAIVALRFAIPILIAVFLNPVPEVSQADFVELQHALLATGGGPAAISPKVQAIAKGIELAHSDPITTAQGKLALGQFQQAIELLDQGIPEEQSALAEAHFYKARSLWALSRFREALGEAEQSLALRPDFAPALVIKCAVLRSLKRLPEALDSCNRAVRAEPTNQIAWNNKGNVLLGMGHFEDALAAFDIGLQSHGNLPQLSNGKAVALHKLGRNEEALAAVNQSLSLAPNYSDALLNKGTILKSLGRSDEAFGVYQELTKSNPTDAMAWNNLGDAYETAGKLAEALTSYDAALQIDPSFGDALFNKGNVLNKLGRYEESQQFLREACRADPKDYEALYQLAFALSKTGQKKRGPIIHPEGT